MKHRGTARKRLLPIETQNSSPLPQPDSGITVDGREIGQIVSVYGARGFALVRLDRLDEAGAAAPQSAGIAVRIARPPWLFGS
jgi:folate-binding Fe-S cluster repair protein YgfZ